jgi:putative ABC transport system permease protein
MIRTIDDLLMSFLESPWNVLGVALFLCLVVLAVAYIQYTRLIFKNLARNPVRTILTGAATLLLVFVITLIWSVLWLLDLVTAEKNKDFKAIVTERWQIPSQMPFAYAQTLEEGAARNKGDVRPQDSMTWQFFGGTLDKAKATRENIVFFFCMDPLKVMKVTRDRDGRPLRDRNGKIRYTSMMDGMDELDEEQILALDAACRAMIEDPRKCVIGKDRLAALNKRVGESMRVSSFNYMGIDLDVEVMAAFPPGRYDQNAVLNREYLNRALDQYEKDHKAKHPLADKTLNLVWLRVPDTEDYEKLARQIETSPSFTVPAVKCETASSGIASFLDAYRDLLWGMRCLLVPAILVTLSLVIAAAISISVRERRIEMAVLKVLGFGPTQILLLVLTEALLVGCLSGLVSAGGTFLFVNKVLGGFKFPIAFFPAFRIPQAALWWGPLVGGLTALAGSLVPAWSARSVKVSEVFAKLA